MYKSAKKILIDYINYKLDAEIAKSTIKLCATLYKYTKLRWKKAKINQ